MRAPGFGLPELLVALALGALLCAAFIEVLDRCRREMTTNESLAQLQDTARQAGDALEADIEGAGFFGLQGANGWSLVRGGAELAAGDALRQPDSSHPRAPVAGLPAGAHDCGVNFVVDLELPVQGSDNTWPAGTGATDCAATAAAGGVRGQTDSLTVRHASRDTVSPRAGRLQAYSRRREAHLPLRLFADGVAPGPQDADAEIRDIEVRSYYVANNSVARAGWPALRVKSLTESAGHAQFRDEEIATGVEDLQIEFGVIDAAAPGVVRYVTADYPGLRTQSVVEVRFWLRIRADVTERGYEDARAMHYANVSFEPGPVESRQRRMLVERTVALRNFPLP